MISIDTETFPIDRGLLAPPMVCYQRWPAEPAILHHTQAGAVIKADWESSKTIVGQNLAYDAAVICASYPELTPVIFQKYDRLEVADVKIAEILIDIAKGTFKSNEKRTYKEGDRKFGHYSLEKIAPRYGLEKDGSDPWRMRYGELYDVPDIELWPKDAVYYAVHDAVVPLQVIEAMLEKHVKYLGDLERQTRAAFCLQLMSCWGVHTDPTKVETLKDKTLSVLLEAQKDLLKAGLLIQRKDGTYKKEQKKAQQYMFEECMRLGLNPKWTKGGLKIEETQRTAKHCSIDEDACDMVGHYLLDQYSLYSRQNTLKTRVGHLSKGYEYPLQARFSPLKETGRTSSSQPSPPVYGIQLQNFSQKLGDRECMIPRPGMCFLAADKSKAELHTWGQVCYDLFGWSDMVDTLNAKQDPYLKFVSVAYGLSYEETAKRYKEGDEEIGFCRQKIGKPIVLGLPGGMGPKTIRESMRKQGTDISVSKSYEYRDIWRDTYKENKPYFAYVNDLLGGREHVQIKQIRADRYRGRAGYCQIANGFFQGLASDAIKEALWKVIYACYVDKNSPLYGWRVWNIVHDEIILEGPISGLHAAAIELKRLMEEGFNKYVPDVPTFAEPVGMMFWSKQAKPIYNDKGEMIPWTP